ncbi:hypothetical protein ES703_102017 [subsurface metagenome]
MFSSIFRSSSSLGLFPSSTSACLIALHTSAWSSFISSRANFFFASNCFSSMLSLVISSFVLVFRSKRACQSSFKSSIFCSQSRILNLVISLQISSLSSPRILSKMDLRSESVAWVNLFNNSCEKYLALIKVSKSQPSKLLIFFCVS